MKKDPPGELARRLTVGNTLQWASMLPRRELQNSQVPLNSETYMDKCSLLPLQKCSRVLSLEREVRGRREAGRR